MRTRILINGALAVMTSLAIACAAAAPSALLAPSPSQAAAARISAELLTRYHYTPKALDATMSAEIFDNYLDALDTERMIFTKADIDRMSIDRAKLSAAILHQDLAIPFSIFNLYRQRLALRLTSARAMVKGGGFDFSQKDSLQIERKDLAWPRSDAEANELWRKRVKNDWLRLRLAGEPDAKIVDALDRRYASALKEVGQTRSDDAFEVFMNAYTMAVDPHTSYMGPRSAQNFDIAMSLSLVGIGASMREKDGYDTVSELTKGGPAIRSGQLAVGDRIVGVAQGEGMAFTSIQGMRLDEAVALIRGPADSVVVLDVLPAKAAADGAHRRVSLVRKKITLDDEAAKKKLITVNEGGQTRRIGIITLPSFYRDFDAQQRGATKVKSVSDDVARLLAELKAEGAQGVLMDLRDNGGGSLTEAVTLTGLFTGKGPVLQERHSDGELVVDNNTTTQATWTGPVGVLINRNSASASEIFAAAIQDYGRGVVIGERSFGKGTVQSTVSLDELAKRPKPEFGELKMTIAQFFRIDGDTTQLRGVVPDITFSTAIDDGAWGEARFNNALPSFKVKPATFVQQEAVRAVTPQLAQRSAERIAGSAEFQDLKQQAMRAAQQRKSNVISLNETERRTERASEVAHGALDLAALVGKPGQLAGADASAGILDDGLNEQERSDALPDRVAGADGKQKDVVLDEAVNVVSDAVKLLQAGTTAAVKVAAPATKAATARTGKAARPAGF